MERQSINKQRDGAFKTSDFSKDSGWNKVKVACVVFLFWKYII